MVPFYSQVEPSVEEGLYPSHYLTKGIQYMYVLIIYLDINIHIYSYFNIFFFYSRMACIDPKAYRKIMKLKGLPDFHTYLIKEILYTDLIHTFI